MRLFEQPQDTSGEPEPVLAIIDMEEKFEASTDPEVNTAIKHLIAIAMREERPIIVVEYGNPDIILPPHSLYRGDTHSELMLPLLFPRRYPKLVVLEKFSNDGSARILEACKQFGFDTRVFQVCGVNSDACVSGTVFGLAVRRPRARVEVITEACNTITYNYDWKHFPQLPNIVLIRPAAQAA